MEIITIGHDDTVVLGTQVSLDALAILCSPDNRSLSTGPHR